jgi:hypothetical protein
MNPEPAYRDGSEGTTGWVTFAGIVLMIVGVMDMIWGLEAILNDKVLTVGGSGVVIWDTTTWGWVQLVLGAIIVLTALGLFAGGGWARWTAVFFVSLNIISTFGIFTLFPFWAMTVVAIDILIIFGLTARWKPSS